jgi:pullulanase
MKRLVGLCLVLLAGVLALTGSAQTALTGKKVILAGTIQEALGGKAWDPAGEITRMNETASGVFEFVAPFRAGRYEYKVAVGGSWQENYGLRGEPNGANIPLTVTVDGTIVKFVFNLEKKEILDSVNNADLVKAPQAYFVSLTTPNPPPPPATEFTNPAPPQITLTTATPAPPPVSSTTLTWNADSATRLTLHYQRARGDYDGWNVWAWPAAPTGGDGKAYPFMGSDAFGKTAVIDVPGKHTRLGFIVRKGEWEAKDTDADRFVDVKDGAAEIWVLQGRKEFFTSKADVDAFLAQAAPPRGEPAFLDAADTVRAWLPKATDPSSLKLQVLVGGKAVAVRAVEPGGPVVGGSSDAADPTKVVLAGTIQGALGGNDWNPNGDVTRMTEVSSGVFEFVAALPKGNFEYKVARGGSWAENYGAGFEKDGGNIAINVPADNTIVRFVVDFNAKTVKDSINNASEVTAPATAPARAQAPKPASGPVQVVNIRLAQPLTARDITQFMEVKIEGDLDRTIYVREFLNDRQFWYSGNDLGSRWSATGTTFKVWSPIASSVELFLFDNPSDGPTDILDMRRGSSGVWFLTAPGDLHGKYYQYRFKSYGETRVAADINAYAASRDSKRSVVVDLKRTNPEGWSTPKSSARPQTESIIYEMHVRDFTVDPSSGVRPEWRGKYMGLTQRNTASSAGLKTGLEYLRDLGVTDIHLLPIQNFNPANSGVYNWGYETTLFNVPEEQYATQPDAPLNTINETKRMIQAMHGAGLRVIMDVVYNHTVPAGGEDSAFWQTVPYFYFRTNDQGQLLNESGVGNAVNDERAMVRKYIRDSVTFWLNEYGIDGYRFDLIGMFTKATVQDLTQTLRKIREDIVLYGEPWTGGGPTRFGKGAQRGTGFAVFNDNIRNAMRGDLDGTRAGFVMGGLTSTTQLMKGIMGSITDFTDSPLETINYVSAHDNLTLWDKLEKSMPDASRDLRARAAQLAGAIVLTSQGVPFLEGGAEIGRTKGGNNNSYNAGDAANRFDWTRAAQFQDVYNYYKGLIAIRKAHRAFRLWDARDIREVIKFLPDGALPNGTVAYTLDGAKVGDPWKRILVVYHGSRNAQAMQLPAGTWRIAANGKVANPNSMGTVTGTLNLEPLSAYILYQ